MAGITRSKVFFFESSPWNLNLVLLCFCSWRTPSDSQPATQCWGWFWEKSHQWIYLGQGCSSVSESSPGAPLSHLIEIEIPWSLKLLRELGKDAVYLLRLRSLEKPDHGSSSSVEAWVILQPYTRFCYLPLWDLYTVYVCMWHGHIMIQCPSAKEMLKARVSDQSWNVFVRHPCWMKTFLTIFCPNTTVPKHTCSSIILMTGRL